MGKNNHGNIGNSNAAKTNKSTAFIHARCKPLDKDAWVVAAKKSDMRLTEWIIKTLNGASQKKMSLENNVTKPKKDKTA